MKGATVTDCANVMFEGIVDDGDFYGSLEPPEGGDQSANLVVSGTTSGVTLKNIYVTSGATGARPFSRSLRSDMGSSLTPLEPKKTSLY